MNAVQDNGKSIYKSVREGHQSRLGAAAQHEDIFTPEELVVGGWEIDNRKATLFAALAQNEIVSPDMIGKAQNDTEFLAGVYNDAFITLDASRLRGDVMTPRNFTLSDQLDVVTSDIDKFAATHELDEIVVMYSGNTEISIDTSDQPSTICELDAMIKSDKQDVIPPSCVYAIAAARASTSCMFVNTAAQNTLSQGLIALFDERGRLAVGRDLKTGQTRLKCVLTEYMTRVGIPLTSIASHNTLGNSDGCKLRPPRNCQSKLNTKSSMTTAIEKTNTLLYPPSESHTGGIEHMVNISYVRSHGDDKRAYDEYDATLMFNRPFSTITRMVCPDTLLAVPILLDIIVFLMCLGGTRGMHCRSATALLALFFKDPIKLESPFFSAQYNTLMTAVCK